MIRWGMCRLDLLLATAKPLRREAGNATEGLIATAAADSLPVSDDSVVFRVDWA
jgi:hypothetical protein